MKRDKRFEIRLTSGEETLFLSMETQLGISRAEIFRRRVLEDSAQLLIDAKTLMRRLDLIGAELGRAGNNINQLARHANILNKRGDMPPDLFEQLSVILHNYATLQSSLEKELRHLIRLMRG